MPYASVNELPKTVKDKIKDEKKLRQFKEVVNAQLKAGKPESVAFASAWSVVQKKQIDVVADIPDDIRAKIADKEGKKAWIAAYSRAYNEGATKDVAEQRAWQYLGLLGYNPDDDGEWVKYENTSFLEKFFRVFAKPKTDSDITQELLEDIDAQADTINKAEYQGKQVELDKPFRTPNESKKFAVYVKDGDTVKIVRFGDPDMEIKRDDPKARDNFRARHSCDTATDKTSARYWSCRMWDDKSVSEITAKNDDTFEITANITKMDDEKRVVYGWASVVEKNGEPVTDRHGDIIDVAELVDAAHEYMLEYREAHEMHKGEMLGETVESIIFTDDVQKALGIDLGQVGWFIGQKIYDDGLWEKYKKGEITAFSIGGRAIKEDYE